MDSDRSLVDSVVIDTDSESGREDYTVRSPQLRSVGD
jgi:hypothetical protein